MDNRQIMTHLLPEILRAESRIRRHIRETPIEYSVPISRAAGVKVHLKMENLQHTGSFKVRGAMNKMLILSEKEREKGVVAASTGNHGAAVAFAATKLKVRSTVFVPTTASRTKIETMQGLGADVRFHGEDCVEAEVHARKQAKLGGMTYISPYNDIDVIAGQGTLGIEIANALQDISRIYVSVGGGGLICGIAAFLKSVHPAIRVVGCSPENSCVMIESLRAGRILDLKSRATLADGSAGGVEPGAVTFELCRTLVDECITVSEEEIAAAMRLCIESHHTLIEGAAGAALAGLLQSARGQGRNNLVVLCGANVSPEALRTVL